MREAKRQKEDVVCWGIEIDTQEKVHRTSTRGKRHQSAWEGHVDVNLCRALETEQLASG
jgi:hypothetical protein